MDLPVLRRRVVTIDAFNYCTRTRCQRSVKLHHQQDQQKIAPGNELNTGTYETHVVPIVDARPIASRFELNKQGFVLNKHSSKGFPRVC